MKLSYRGIQYNQTPVSLEAEVIQTTGRYRGGEYKINCVSRSSAKKTHSAKTYRGISY